MLVKSKYSVKSLKALAINKLKWILKLFLSCVNKLLTNIFRINFSQISLLILNLRDLIKNLKIKLNRIKFSQISLLILNIRDLIKNLKIKLNRIKFSKISLLNLRIL